MAGQVLYRKWRPQRFEEIIGQEHVTRTLQRALTSSRTAHAYLFAGPRGTGKTSTARIMAKAVNCTGGPPLPCNTCPTCVAINEGRALDLIEIDAASNRGIDEIRDLRERVKFSPAEARYKVYIIDEAHMLTTEACNALLKTLEEPPRHVIFILATTEPQRIPATVLSRCQRFDFRRVRVAEIVKRLESIVQAESLQATRPALELVARTATGSMRDAESLLDQLQVYGRDGTLDVPEVQALLGLRGHDRVPGMVDALIGGDIPGGLGLVQNLVDDGVDLRQFNREFVSYLRGLLFLAVTRDGADLLDVTSEVLEEMRSRAQRTNVTLLARWVRRFSSLDADLKAGWYGQLPLELALIESILPLEQAVAPQQDKGQGPTPSPSRTQRSPSSPPRPREQKKQAGSAAVQSAPAPSIEREGGNEPAQAQQQRTPSPQPQGSTGQDGRSGEGSPSLEYVQELWPKVIEDTRPVDPSVQALLHSFSCQPIGVEGHIVVLGFRYAFHKGKIEEVRNRRIVEQVLSKVLGGNYGIRCVMDESTSSPSERRRQAQDRQRAQQDPRVKAAANIFNARIVDIEPGTEAE